MRIWLTLLGIAATCFGQATAATQYRLTDLGNLYPTDINSVGQIVGNYSTSGPTDVDYRGLLMPGGYTATPIDLGFPDDVFGDGPAINSVGQVASRDSYQQDFWTPSAPNGAIGAITSLTDAYDLENPYTRAIGNDGTLIGYGWDFDNGGGFKSFVWKPSSPNGTTGVMHTLGGGNGASVMLAGINDRGNIAGVDANGGFVFIPNVPNGIVGTNYPLGVDAMAMTSSPAAINDSGQIVGHVIVGARRHAMIWNPTSVNGSTGTIVDGLLPGRSQSFAVDVNSDGNVIGISSDNSANALSFIWNPVDGMVNLETLLDATGAGWRLYSVSAINDLGQIVGEGRFDPDGPGGVAETLHGFVLTPVPEPTSLALMAAALVCGVVRRGQLRR